MLFPIMKPPPVDGNWIKARVIVKKLVDTDNDQDWPKFFLSVPQRGDKVRTPAGRVLDVLSVVHTHIDGSPLIEVEIGIDEQSVTPTEGGGQGEGFL